ncbi:hypothetical protein HNV12_03065 [Methanococcoides sp. SA1]|nr:hypothetical protein [Methanococcoides sp. SA1]
MVLKSKKNVFWEALLITIVIFLAGLFLGMLIEADNSNKISNLYIQSEISLTDAMSSSNLIEEAGSNCEVIKNNNIKFADQIYEEAKLLEQYEASGKLTDSMTLLHKKYDLLRTILWTSNQKTIDKCHNYNMIVYLYDYETEDTEVKAVQNVWSKMLLSIKSQKEDILLLPIAADEELISINLLIDKYQIEKLPAIIINNEEILYELETADPVLNLLN